jgi:Domain of unknown function (DUF5667)
VAPVTPLLGRREQRFAELVDEAAGRHRRTDLDPELAPLVTLATRLGGSGLRASPREEYRLGLRAMLQATIDREGIGATAVIPAQRTRSGPAGNSSPTNPGARRRRTRIAVLIGVSGALALSGVSQASVNAQPGDPLYSVKRSAERAQLALAGSDVTRGKLLFDYANTRLQEGVLADMNAQSAEGFRLLASDVVDRHSQSSLTMLEDLVRQQQDRFAKVGAALQADTRWQTSTAVLKDESDRLQLLRSWLAGRCGPVLKPPDAYGPVPTDCPGTSSTSSEAGG